MKFEAILTRSLFFFQLDSEDMMAEFSKELQKRLLPFFECTNSRIGCDYIVK